MECSTPINATWESHQLYGIRTGHEYHTFVTATNQITTVV